MRIRQTAVITEQRGAKVRAIKNIEKRIKNVNIAIDSERNKKVFSNILQGFEKSKAREFAPTGQNIWRIILKSPIIKLTAAAAIIAIAALSITLLDKSVIPSYAIEQTIEASRGLRHLYFEYFVPLDDEPVKECWAEFDKNGQLKKVRVNLHKHWGDREIVQVWNEGNTQIWRKEANSLQSFNLQNHTEKILKLVRECDPRTAVESLYMRQVNNGVKIEIDEPAERTKPIVLRATFAPGKYLLENPNLPSFREVLFIDRETKLVTAIEVYELKEGKYKYNGVWKYRNYDRPFDNKIFSLKDELPSDIIPIDSYTKVVVVKSPVEMMTATSLERAFRRGGLEAVENQCEQALKLLGTRTDGLSSHELLSEFNGS
jgi:hypothetical protein